MKKILAVILCSMFLTACWNPKVREVPLWGLWQTMQLPVETDAKVWVCDTLQLKIVHKGGRQAITRQYLDFFEDHGWTKTLQQVVPNESSFRFAKGNMILDVEIYEFEKTGVIIRRVV